MRKHSVESSVIIGDIFHQIASVLPVYDGLRCQMAAVESHFCTGPELSAAFTVINCKTIHFS